MPWRISTVSEDGDICRVQSNCLPGLGLDGDQVCAANFPLPTLEMKLLRAAVSLHEGRGFAVIRGLKPDGFSPEDNVILFLGLSSYLGSQRGRQDEEGNMLSTPDSVGVMFCGQYLIFWQCISAMPSYHGSHRAIGRRDILPGHR